MNSLFLSALSFIFSTSSFSTLGHSTQKLAFLTIYLLVSSTRTFNIEAGILNNISICIKHQDIEHRAGILNNISINIQPLNVQHRSWHSKQYSITEKFILFFVFLHIPTDKLSFTHILHFFLYQKTCNNNLKYLITIYLSVLNLIFLKLSGYQHYEEVHFS